MFREGLASGTFACENVAVDTLRIATLGAAKITPAALIKPAREAPGVEVAAVAARDPARARGFASKHGIPKVHVSYEDLLADPAVDAVYNPLPNGLHGKWTMAALSAGKHVLCEKPFTANATEAAEVAAAAEASGLVVMEAFHWRYHPLAQRLIDVVSSGQLGTIRRIDAWVCFPLPFKRDIRYRFDLAGGATMDAGCYAINIVRTLAGAEPTVANAVAKRRLPDIDRAMRAELSFADGRTAGATCSMWSAQLLRVAVRVTGEAGRVDALNPIAPQVWNRLTVRTGGTRTTERVRGPSTYSMQLRAFEAAVRDGAEFPSTPDDAVANMRVIDDVYRAAGLPVRQPSR
jgi:predicted dehydrogenase